MFFADCAWQTYTFLAVRFVYTTCLSLKWQNTSDCITQYSLVMIFAASEPTQYIVVFPTGCEMKNISQLIQNDQN